MKRRHVMNQMIMRVIVGGMLMTGAAAQAQFRIHVKPYLGVGYSRILDDYRISFAVEDSLDAQYQALNLEDAPMNVFRGQLRVDILHWGPVSAGYLFWGHQAKFKDTAPDNQLKTDKIYPFSVMYNLHGANLTLRLPFDGISTEQRVPFIMGGAGRYYGKNKGYRYVWLDEAHTENEKQFTTQKKWDDWGYFAGIGVEIYRFAYVYAGYTALMGDGLMGAQFFDVVIGVTF